MEIIDRNLAELFIPSYLNGQAHTDITLRTQALNNGSSQRIQRKYLKHSSLFLVQLTLLVFVMSVVICKKAFNLGLGAHRQPPTWPGI